MILAVWNGGIAQGSGVLIDAKQRWRRVDLFLAIRFVVQNHISRAAPEMCADRCERHVWWAEL